MSESPKDSRVTLESIQWREVFPFTHLFRTFRLTVHPNKLLVALAAVMICYVGGRFLDLFAQRAVVVEQPFYTLRLPADEIQKYISSPTMVEFYRWRDQARARNEQLLDAAVVEYLKTPAKGKKLSGEDALDNLASELKTRQARAARLLDDHYHKAVQALDKDYDRDQGKAADKAAFDKNHRQAKEQLVQAYEYLRLALWKSTRVAGLVTNLNATQALSTIVRDTPSDRGPADRTSVSKDRTEILNTIAMADTYDRIKASRGLGIFQAALTYGILMFNSAVDSVLALHFFSNPAFKGFDLTPDEPPGLVKTLGLGIQGLGWFVRVHWLYFIVYGLFCLAIWSVAGGTICRIAALHATRDEKIPFREAFGFAVRKMGSFFTAPLMPVIFILGCCLPLLGLGAIGSIPWIGEIVVGLGFFVVLLISFVLAMIIIGGIAGVGLMYPTIAVEGSDTFDAFSRSYSYIYARPWRTIFYTLVTAVYGTLCFVFVKLLVALVFKSAATIVGATMNWDTAGYAAPLGKLEAMWFSPTLSGPFFGRFYLFELNWSEALASFFIAFWVFLLVGAVIAFAISFFFCGYTLIYLLLRRCVDATELDEVYVEELESQLTQPVPMATGSAGTLPVPPATPATTGETTAPAAAGETATPAPGPETPAPEANP